jgi:drug/metabolite transporter (DMT)-like permease
MLQLIRQMTPETKNCMFAFLFSCCFVLGLCPFPDWVSHITPYLFGLPFSVAYMILAGFLITASIMAIYLVERIRKELD